MKNALKAVLLGGAASLVSLAGAHAADLPVAEPVEYVKVCETYGVGFFYIPGTDTCIRVGGYVRFQIHSQTDNAKEDYWESDPFTLSADETTNDTYGMFVRGLVNFDARTETEYGTMRSFIQIRGNAFDQDNASMQLDKAFLQFAGITAGLAPTVFTHDHPTDYIGTHIADWTADTIQLSYTAELGSGFSASVGIESAERADNAAADNLLLGEAEARALGVASDGQTETPAAVAALRVKQTWGSATLAAAVGETKSSAELNEFVGGKVGKLLDEDDSDEIGWAVGAGLTVNLPSLAEGDAITVKAGYSDGLSWYVQNGGSFVAGNHTWTFDDEDNLTVENTQVFTAYAGLLHNWSSDVRSSFGLNYVDIDFGHGAEAQGGTVSGNVIWSPVKNLDIGLELFYSNLEVNEGGNDVLGVGDDETDGFGAIFRIQRNFGS